MTTLPVYPTPKYHMVMSENEKQCFINSIKQSKLYLEFGAGGSTLCALLESEAKVISIESDSQWIKSVSESKYVKEMISINRLKIVHIDIGPTRKWGFPKGLQYKNLFPKYSSEIYKSDETIDVDTVFIDGRFRVACTLQSIHQYKDKDNIQIMIHDFVNRPHYHVVLTYLEIVKQVDTLVICKIKNNIDLDMLIEDYNKFKYNPK